MIINGKECVFMFLWAEAYYSCQTANDAMFIPLDFYNKHKEAIDEFVPSWCELDGKHSETDGEVTVFDYIDTDFARQYDSWELKTMRSEELLWDLCEEGEFNMLKDFHKEIYRSVKIMTERTFIYGNQAFQF